MPPNFAFLLPFLASIHKNPILASFHQLPFWGFLVLHGPKVIFHENSNKVVILIQFFLTFY